ncbi:MAG: glutamate--tRNA ligase [Gammaproteobacteria bacterium]
MSKKHIRVRFAPSPTGSLHLGGARTALYNYLFAKKHDGQFILRVEDTDAERSTQEALQTQLADLHWLGLSWDEGPDANTLKDIGPHAPYCQSLRLETYQKYVDQLLTNEQAYYCFLTDEEIKQQREAAQVARKPYQVHSPYRDLPPDQAQQKLQQGDKATVRFKIPSDKINYTFTDLVRGAVTLPSDMVADFVILRADDMPVYNFSCVIDDALMAISHVFRGEEHLSNTLRQLMLYEALNFTAPEFGHLSMILGENKKKLSKREAAVSCHDFQQQGYLPQAILNYIALLGWTDPDGRDILSLTELVQAFSAEGLNASPAVFDRQRLKWVNAQHLRQMPAPDLWQAITPFLQQAGLTLPQDPTWQSKSLQLFVTDMEILEDAIERYRPLDDKEFKLNEEALEVLQWDSSSTVVAKWQTLIEQHAQSYLSAEDFQKILESIKHDCQVKGKHLFMPIRVAVIGKPHGAELKSLVQLLNKEQLKQRAQQCLDSLHA